MKDKKKKVLIKSKLHPRNKNNKQYDFKLLIEKYPELEDFIVENIKGKDTIDFFDPAAVLTLNTIILKHYYGLKYWKIPEGYLCPPIPGRADYIHYIADLLAAGNKGKIPKGKKVKVLDIGVGANCIYPIIGSLEYGWDFVGSEVDKTAFESAQNIIKKNAALKDKIEIRLQENRYQIFEKIVKKGERFDVCICNPPFHSSLKEANNKAIAKLKKLNQPVDEKALLNFGGQKTELIYKGGELAFIKNMIKESKHFFKTCKWYTSLVSQKGNLKAIYNVLKSAKAAEVKTIEMGQGNKQSRIVAWRF